MTPDKAIEAAEASTWRVRTGNSLATHSSGSTPLRRAFGKIWGWGMGDAQVQKWQVEW